MLRPLKDISYKFPFLNGNGYSSLKGVYLILKEERVMYVGKSLDVTGRVSRHYGYFGGLLTGSSGGDNYGRGRLSRKLDGNFDKVLFVQEENPLLQTILEEFYIWKYDPPYNAKKPKIHVTNDEAAYKLITRLVYSRRAWKSFRKSL
jgi:excinuclease UvrABC nuclease subunit